MKKYLAICCAAAIGFLVASDARAQSAPGVHFGVSAGPGAPTGDTRESYETGFNGSAFLNWTPPVSPVGLRVEGMYQNMDIEPEFGEAGDAEIIAGLAGAVIAPKNGTVKPYAVAGGGVAFPLGKTNVFVEARYHSINNEGRDTERLTLIPVTIGITF